MYTITITAIVELGNIDSSNPISQLDQINAEIAKSEAERANVFAKMKADINLYGFKTKDFKGVLLTRAKRETGTAAKKAPK